MKTHNYRQSAIIAAIIASIGSFSYFSNVIAPLAQQATQTFYGRLQNGLPNRPSLSGGTNPNAGIYFGSATKFTGITGKLAAGTETAATPSACTNCTLATGSSDSFGAFTTSSTTAGITFGTAWTSAPSCLLQPQGTATAAGSATQPTFRVLTTGLHADVVGNTTLYSYICIGKSGG